MPNYDYQCTKCGQEIEITHSIKEDARTHEKHPKQNCENRGEVCNGKLKRLISKTSFTFADGAPTPKHYN